MSASFVPGKRDAASYRGAPPARTLRAVAHDAEGVAAQPLVVGVHPHGANVQPVFHIHHPAIKATRRWWRRMYGPSLADRLRWYTLR